MSTLNTIRVGTIIKIRFVKKCVREKEDQCLKTELELVKTFFVCCFCLYKLKKFRYKRNFVTLIRAFFEAFLFILVNLQKK